QLVDSPGCRRHGPVWTRPIGLSNQARDLRAFAKLAGRHRERPLVRRPGLAGLVVALREMLRELLDDLFVARGVSGDVRQTFTHVVVPLHGPTLGVTDSGDAVERLDELVPEAALALQHLAAFRGQAIEAAAALSALLDPAALDPPSSLESVQHGIERRDLKADRTVGARLDLLADLVAVARSPLKQREDHQLGAALLDLA